MRRVFSKSETRLPYKSQVYGRRLVTQSNVGRKTGTAR